MDDNEYLELLIKDCVNILIKYPKIFTISEIMTRYVKRYPKDEQQFVLFVTLQTRIGLASVVRENFKKANHFRFIDSNRNIRNNIIVATLNSYSSQFLFKSDRENWEEMLKNENLTMS